MDKKETRAVRQEIDKVVAELRNSDVSEKMTDEKISQRGLGDLVERVLTRFGITQERFKQWTGLEECGCTGRKAWLNRLVSWPTQKKS